MRVTFPHYRVLLSLNFTNTLAGVDLALPGVLADGLGTVANHFCVSVADSAILSIKYELLIHEVRSSVLSHLWSNTTLRADVNGQAFIEALSRAMTICCTHSADIGCFNIVLDTLPPFIVDDPLKHLSTFAHSEFRLHPFH